jgi:hypothetical protein
MHWNNVLDKWANGDYFTYPSILKTKFQWNTSVLRNDGNSKFNEKFKTNKELPKTQSSKSFREYIVKSTNKYVISFKNPSKDTLLVIPTPRPGKNYATIKDFCDNAPIVQQKEFWMAIAKLARTQMKKENTVWVSAHGLGVPYFHIRICNKPKYYFDTQLAKE